ncbi:MAG TPA: hypothetical protein VGI65_00760, partial [Steroidobacteraceae bacterium]
GSDTMAKAAKSTLGGPFKFFGSSLTVHRLDYGALEFESKQRSVRIARQGHCRPSSVGSSLRIQP